MRRLRVRHSLYRFARLLGDLHAVEAGRVPQRLIRRQIYKRASKAAGWLSRKIGL